MKSRLTMPPVLCQFTGRQKRNVGVTHVPSGRSVALDYTPGRVAASNGWSLARARTARRVAPLDVVLEDPDELGDQALAAERAIELAVDEHRRDRVLERARQRDADVRVF